MKKHFPNKKYQIKRFQFWTLLLHANQSYLGRVICHTNDYKENITDLHEDEYKELKNIIQQYQEAVTRLWHPDWYNYAQFGNIVPHLHFHFIPRYKTSRTFLGAKFRDERWGGNYAPAPERPEDQKLNSEITLAITNTLR